MKYWSLYFRPFDKRTIYNKYTFPSSTSDPTCRFDKDHKWHFKCKTGMETNTSFSVNLLPHQNDLTRGFLDTAGGTQLNVTSTSLSSNFSFWNYFIKTRSTEKQGCLMSLCTRTQQILKISKEKLHYRPYLIVEIMAEVIETQNMSYLCPSKVPVPW